MTRVAREQTRSSPSAEGERTTLRVRWDAFQRNGEIADGVRPEIAASWRRSAGVGLAPELAGAPIDEPVLRLRDSGPARRRFLRAGMELADELGAELGDTPATVVVCDDFGMVVHRVGSPAALHRAESVNLVPGGSWSEASVGTTGIGLALCRKIVQFHGGQIWLADVESGSGATFRFTLPEGDRVAQSRH